MCSSRESRAWIGLPLRNLLTPQKCEAGREILATHAMKGMEILALTTDHGYPTGNMSYLGYKFKENIIHDSCQRTVRWILFWSSTAGGTGMSTQGSSTGDRGGLDIGGNKEKCKHTAKEQVGVSSGTIRNRKHQG